MYRSTHSLISALDVGEDGGLGGPQSWFVHGVKEKKSQPPPGLKPQSPDCPAHCQLLYD